MAHFGDTLRRLINDRHIDLAEFPKLADIGEATMYRNLRSATPAGTQSTYRAIAKGLGITPAQLDAEWKDSEGDAGGQVLPGNFTIPFISRGSAGRPREYEVDLMNSEGVPGALYPYPRRDPMAVRVSGDSMSWDRRESIEDGDAVIFANEYEENIPDNAQVVARLLDDDSLLVKRVKYIDAENLLLVSQNSRFDPEPVRRDRVILRRVKVIVHRSYLGHLDG